MLLYSLLLLPALAGVLCILFSQWDKKHSLLLLIPQGFITGLIIFIVLSGLTPAAPAYSLSDTLSFSLQWDPLGGFFAALVSVCWLLSIPYAAVYMSHEAHLGRFYTFFFLTESAVLGTALAADLMTLYLFFELATLFSFPLVLHSGSDKALLGGRKYLYYSVGGAFMALFGAAVVYETCHTLSFTPGGILHQTSPLTALGVFLMILGFGAKAGLYPLHHWLPSAHPAAPSPASAVLSGLITKCGVIAIVRILFCVADPTILQGTWVQYAAIVLTLVTVVMGSLLACWEKELKRRLAYSSISQISYVLLGFFLLTPHGAAGALLQFFFHALVKIGLFQCAGAIIFLTGCTQVTELRGIGRRIPITMLCFTLFSLSLVGIPPFGGFWSKWHLCLAALESLPAPLSYLSCIALIVSALLTAGYLFAPVLAAFFPGKDCPVELTVPVKEPAAMVLSLVILSLGCAVPGLFPQGLLAVLERIVSTL